MPVQKSGGTIFAFTGHCMMSRIWYSDGYSLPFRQTGLVKRSSEAIERAMSPTALQYGYSMADPGSKYAQVHDARCLLGRQGQP